MTLEGDEVHPRAAIHGEIAAGVFDDERVVARAAVHGGGRVIGSVLNGEGVGAAAQGDDHRLHALAGEGVVDQAAHAGDLRGGDLAGDAGRALGGAGAGVERVAPAARVNVGGGGRAANGERVVAAAEEDVQRLDRAVEAVNRNAGARPHAEAGQRGQRDVAGHGRILQRAVFIVRVVRIVENHLVAAARAVDHQGGAEALQVLEGGGVAVGVRIQIVHVEGALQRDGREERPVDADVVHRPQHHLAARGFGLADPDRAGGFVQVHVPGGAQVQFAVEGQVHLALHADVCVGAARRLLVGGVDDDVSGVAVFYQGEVIGAGRAGAADPFPLAQGRFFRLAGGLPLDIAAAVQQDLDQGAGLHLRDAHRHISRLRLVAPRPQRQVDIVAGLDRQFGGHGLRLRVLILNQFDVEISRVADAALFGFKGQVVGVDPALRGVHDLDDVAAGVDDGGAAVGVVNGALQADGGLFRAGGERMLDDLHLRGVGGGVQGVGQRKGVSVPGQVMPGGAAARRGRQIDRCTAAGRGDLEAVVLFVDDVVFLASHQPADGVVRGAVVERLAVVKAVLLEGDPIVGPVIEGRVVGGPRQVLGSGVSAGGRGQVERRAAHRLGEFEFILLGADHVIFLALAQAADRGFGVRRVDHDLPVSESVAAEGNPVVCRSQDAGNAKGDIRFGAAVDRVDAAHRQWHQRAVVDAVVLMLDLDQPEGELHLGRALDHAGGLVVAAEDSVGLEGEGAAHQVVERDIADFEAACAINVQIVGDRLLGDGAAPDAAVLIEDHFRRGGDEDIGAEIDLALGRQVAGGVCRANARQFGVFAVLREGRFRLDGERGGGDLDAARNSDFRLGDRVVRRVGRAAAQRKQHAICFGVRVDLLVDGADRQRVQGVDLCVGANVYLAALVDRERGVEVGAADGSVGVRVGVRFALDGGYFGAQCDGIARKFRRGANAGFGGGNAAGADSDRGLGLGARADAARIGVRPRVALGFGLGRCGQGALGGDLRAVAHTDERAVANRDFRFASAHADRAGAGGVADGFPVVLGDGFEGDISTGRQLRVGLDIDATLVVDFRCRKQDAERDTADVHAVAFRPGGVLRCSLYLDVLGGGNHGIGANAGVDVRVGDSFRIRAETRQQTAAGSHGVGFGDAAVGVVARLDRDFAAAGGDAGVVVDIGIHIRLEGGCGKRTAGRRRPDRHAPHAHVGGRIRKRFDAHVAADRHDGVLADVGQHGGRERGRADVSGQAPIQSRRNRPGVHFGGVVRIGLDDDLPDGRPRRLADAGVVGNVRFGGAFQRDHRNRGPGGN